MSIVGLVKNPAFELSALAIALALLAPFSITGDFQPSLAQPSLTATEPPLNIPLAIIGMFIAAALLIYAWFVGRGPKKRAGSIDMFTPTRVVIGCLLGVVLVGMVIVIWAAGGFGGSSVSTQLTSTSNGLITLLPFLGAILASGMFYIALDSRRH